MDGFLPLGAFVAPEVSCDIARRMHGQLADALRGNCTEQHTLRSAVPRLIATLFVLRQNAKRRALAQSVTLASRLAKYQGQLSSDGLVK